MSRRCFAFSNVVGDQPQNRPIGRARVQRFNLHVSSQVQRTDTMLERPASNPGLRAMRHRMYARDVLGEH